MRSTRSSKRFAGLRSGLSGVSGSGVLEKIAKTVEMAIEVEKHGLPNNMYIIYWNLSKMRRLTSWDERKEWVDNILPLGAKARFEIYREAELGCRIAHAIYEVSGIL